MSIRCKLGLHRWTDWKINEKDILERRCERCGKTQLKYLPSSYYMAKLKVELVRDVLKILLKVKDC